MKKFNRVPIPKCFWGTMGRISKVKRGGRLERRYLLPAHGQATAVVKGADRTYICLRLRNRTAQLERNLNDLEKRGDLGGSVEKRISTKT